jgi:hypothetical protein
VELFIEWMRGDRDHTQFLHEKKSIHNILFHPFFLFTYLLITSTRTIQYNTIQSWTVV